MERNTRRRRLALGAAALLLSPLAAIVASAPSPVDAQTEPQAWPVEWDLNRTHDVEELSRVFDQDEDGWIDNGGTPAADIQSMLNAQEFSIHARACAAPPGHTSIEFTLVPVGGGEPYATASAPADSCEVDLPLPERPYPDAKEYDLVVAAHYPEAPDSIVTDRVKVRDVFMVGLGDSYGSGEGNPLDAWHFGDPHAEWDNNRCHRSRLSGQEQAARMLDSIQGINVTFLHLACSGAKATEGILEPYAGLIVEDGMAPLPTQIEQAAAYVAYSHADPAQRRWPDIVVTSIGGNDAGFADVVTACLAPPWIPIPIGGPFFVPYDLPECHEPGAAADEFFKPGLEKIPGLYGQINEAINGRVDGLPRMCHPDRGCEFLITEYPDGATNEDMETCSHYGFTEDEFEWVRTTMVTDLNTKIRETAEPLGWTYVHGVRAAFDRHGICSSDDWFRDIFESFEIQKDKNGAFHPDAAGHFFGYAPEIAESARYALGFPYPWSTMSPPAYLGTTPETCSTTVEQGSVVPAPPAQVEDLDIPDEIKSQLLNGTLPTGMAGHNTCGSSASASRPSGAAVQELRTGRPGCPDDPRPCKDTSAASTLLRFPVYGDPQPVIDVRAEADVALSAGQPSSDDHRMSGANAQGRTVFLAAGFGESPTVTGEVVVDLTAYAQAGGADADGLADLRVDVTAVDEQECAPDDEECSPLAHYDVADLELEVERYSCEQGGELEHGCSTYGGNRNHTDEIRLEAYSGNTPIVEIDEYDTYPTGGAIGGGMAVVDGVRTPVRTVRIPFSVPAGSVVEVMVSAGAYTATLPLCAADVNDFDCTASARMGGRVWFETDSSGAIVPLSGFTGLPVDGTPPTVTATPTGPAGENGWFTGPVNVALSATDEGDGVETLHYTVTGQPAVVVEGAEANISISTNGRKAIRYWAVDGNGNESEPQTLTINVDTGAPTVTVGVADGSSHEQGAVVPTGLGCSDAISPVVSCTGPAQLDTSTLGTHQATFTAVDEAGHTASTTISYHVVAPPPPAPMDLISLEIKEDRFSVSGEVVSGGFDIVRNASGSPTAIAGTAEIRTPTGSVVTVSVLAVKLAGRWTGATRVVVPDKGIDVTASASGPNDLRPVGDDALAGRFTQKKPKATISWTITDRG